MNQKVQDLQDRTRLFALKTIKLYTSLPKTTEAQILGKQMLRSGTSVGAHLHEGKRSRSVAELISKTEAALQELEETKYWLRLIHDAGIVRDKKIPEIFREAEELTSILVSGVKTLKTRRASP